MNEIKSNWTKSKSGRLRTYDYTARIFNTHDCSGDYVGKGYVSFASNGHIVGMTQYDENELIIFTNVSDAVKYVENRVNDAIKLQASLDDWYAEIQKESN